VIAQVDIVLSCCQFEQGVGRKFFLLGWPCTFQYNKVLTTFPFDTRASFKVLGRNTCRDGTAWESFPLMSTPTSNTSTMALCGRRHYELNKTVSPIRRTANQQSTITIKQCHSQQTRLPPNTTTGNETQHTSQTAPPLATTLSPQGLKWVQHYCFLVGKRLQSCLAGCPCCCTVGWATHTW
jgi:hypothetical protein